MNIFLTGATGVLGKQLITAINQKYSVTALEHTTAPHYVNGINWVRGDLRHLYKLKKIIEKNCCVIHLAAVTHSDNISQYYDVNETGTMNLVRISEEQSIKHFIFVSTRAIDPEGGAYSQSKIAAEEIVKKSKLNWTILRPSEVYGGNSTEMLTTIIQWIKKYKFIPIPGNGLAKVAPLLIDNLLHFILQIINNEKAFEKIYILAGPMQYTLIEFVDIVSFYLGKRNKPIKVKVPLIFFRLILELNAKLKLSKRLCRDQIDRLQVSKCADFSLAAEDFGFSPDDLKQGLILLNLN